MRNNFVNFIQFENDSLPLRWYYICSCCGKSVNAILSYSLKVQNYSTFKLSTMTGVCYSCNDKKNEILKQKEIKG